MKKRDRELDGTHRRNEGTEEESGEGKRNVAFGRSLLPNRQLLPPWLSPFLRTSVVAKRPVVDLRVSALDHEGKSAITPVWPAATGVPSPA